MPEPSRHNPRSTTAGRVAAIALAGGSGSRMRGAVADKVLQPLAGKPVIRHSLDAFAACGQIDCVVIVHRDEAQKAAIASSLSGLPMPLLWALGGPQRQDSVWSGLQALPPDTEIALIHDAARPLVTKEAIQSSIDAARAAGAACLARPVSDTIKTVAAQGTRFIPRTLDRSTLWAMETPQTFSYPLIHQAYQRIIESGRPVTDDLSAIEAESRPVIFIDNGRPNPKLTTPHDLPYLEFLLSHEVSLNPLSHRG